MNDKSPTTMSTNDLRFYNPFGLVSEKQLETLVEKSVVLNFDAGQSIFREGSTTFECYYLLNGVVNIVKDNRPSDNFLFSDKPESCESLNSIIPRNGEIVAATKCEVLLLSQDLIDLSMECNQTDSYGVIEISSFDKSSIQGTSPTQVETVETNAHNDSHWMSVFIQSPLFHRIPPSMIQHFFSSLEDVEVDKGQAIIRAGEEADYFYIVKEGKAIVLKEHEVNRSIQLECGDIFGEEGLISDSVRSATVVMLTDGTISRLNRAQFKEIVQDHHINHVDTDTIKEWYKDSAKKVVLLDVRLSGEYKHGHLKGSKNLPLMSLRQRLQELDKNTTYIVSDEGGKRSELATHLISQSGLNAYLVKR